MKTKEQKLVEQIHNEFRTAQIDLEETFEVMKKDPEITKNERLEKLGFTRLVDTHEINAMKKMRAINETIEKYKFSHPTNKLITDFQMHEICEKYNLIFGEVSRYLGEIPEKNVIEMENFKFPKNHRGSLFICAPQKEMYLSPYERIQNHRIVAHVPDPVVLCAVENGLYLVVTAWGAEGKDEIIFNPKNN